MGRQNRFGIAKARWQQTRAEQIEEAKRAHDRAVRQALASIGAYQSHLARVLDSLCALQSAIDVAREVAQEATNKMAPEVGYEEKKP